jgi:hypothetical protein
VGPRILPRDPESVAKTLRLDVGRAVCEPFRSLGVRTIEGVDRKDARLFLIWVPAVAGALRASAGLAGLSWTSLHALYVLSQRDGLSVDELAAHVGVAPSRLSSVLGQLRSDGYVRETSCADHPDRCSARQQPCGKHRYQWPTELGLEVAHEWSEPYLQLLTGSGRLNWRELVYQMRSVGDLARRRYRRRRAQRAQARSGQARRTRRAA